jgi:thiol-disulfide isomerase/thioredoxin
MSNPAQLLAALALGAFVALAVIGAPVVARDAQTMTPVPERPAAPAFDLKDPDGRPVRLADFRGKPLIVNFWATWCPPCREEMPSMQRALDLLSNDEIGLIAINVGEDADTISQFLANARLKLPVLLDETSGVVMRYPVRGLPTTFVVDAEGRLAYVVTGGRDWDDPVLLDQVRALRQ